MNAFRITRKSVLQAFLSAAVAFSAAAWVPLSTIESWRNGASDVVTMTVLSVEAPSTTVPNRGMGPGATATTTNVTVRAKVDAVTRSSTGLAPGSQITLRYTVTRHVPVVPDGNIGFVLNQGERASAYLKRSPGGDYELAGAFGCLSVLSASVNDAGQAEATKVAPPPGTERRVALIIGNGAYAHVPALSNPPNDARMIGEALRSVGFTSVRTETDLRRDALINALKTFAAEAEGADWAVVYFAGHGIEVAGANWLIPVDAALKTDRDVQFEAVSLEQVMGAVESTKQLGLVILDACRDNPFAAQMRVTIAGRSITRGLAAIEPRRGALVAYAAKHGQVALDGTGANSPFVSALVRNLQRPGVEINKVFRLVRDDVLAATNDRQEPFVYGSLPARDFFFAK